MRIRHPLRCVHEPDAAGSDPEPDLAVTAEDRRAHLGRRVGAADVDVVIEVSYATRAYDPGPKARVYARAGVVEYWVVDLLEERVVHHTEPSEQGYAQVTSSDLDEAVTSSSGLRVLVGRDVLRADATS